MTTFVDNACWPVIERHIVIKLPGILNVSDCAETVGRRNRAERDGASGQGEQVKVLSDSLGDLQS